MMHGSFERFALLDEGVENCDTLLVSDAGKLTPTYAGTILNYRCSSIVLKWPLWQDRA